MTDQRDNLGRFKPGASGNVHGRGKGWKNVARSILEQTNSGEEMIAFVLRVFRDETRSHAERWAALEVLLARGLGRPTNVVDAEIAVSSTENSLPPGFHELSPADRMRVLDAYEQRLLGSVEDDK